MRIGNGPRLVVPRPGILLRRGGWSGYYLYRGQAYDLWRDQRRKQLRMTARRTAGDAKPQTVQLSSLKPGEHYRLVDANGRTTGPRLTATGDEGWGGYSALVRRVVRQPEDYHSHISRMLKRAHKLAIKEAP